VRWYAARQLIYWRPDRSTPSLGDELLRVFGDCVDIQEGTSRRLTSFYVGRQKLDALFPTFRIALEVVRSLHGNSDRTKLRIFMNEAIKPAAEPRSPGYSDYAAMVLHYFEAHERSLFRAAIASHVSAPSDLRSVESLFGAEPRLARVPLRVLSDFASRAALSGDSKDKRYWGEIKRRGEALLEAGCQDLQFRPVMTWSGETNLPGAVLVEINGV
jgi:hypothetical protein